MRTSQRPVLVVARWSILVLGVGLATFSFVRLVEVNNDFVLAAPWWWLGLIGVAGTLLALGPPRSDRPRRDGGS